VDEHRVEVSWQVENETSILKYELEHASDGRRFNQIGTRNPEANNGGWAGYMQMDANALSTENFYRVKAISQSGLIQYSPVVKVSGIQLQSSISVYPNPVINKTIQLSFTNKAAGNYTARLINNLGQVIQTWKLSMNGNQEVHSLIVGHRVASGNYVLKVQHESGEESVTRILIQ
jgi:hypothetical protein